MEKMDGAVLYKSDKGDPPFLMQNEGDSSPIDHQSGVMKDIFNNEKSKKCLK